MLFMTKTSMFAQTPLKDMDGAALALAIMEEFPSDGVRRALTAASFLHRNQTRANRGTLPRTAYIEHPLRGSLRAIRWGVSSEDIVIAIILHDVAEDCAEEAAAVFRGCPEASPERARGLTFAWMVDEWGLEVARLVRAVTNPLPGQENLTREQKRREYARHVKDAITGDAAAFIVKIIDYADNASGLHHNATGANTGMVAHLAAKYGPLADIFAAEYRANPGISLLMSDAGFAEAGAKIDKTRERLLALAA